MVGCYKLFGVTEFAARFFEAASAAILVTRHILSCALLRQPSRFDWAATLLTAPLFAATGNCDHRYALSLLSAAPDELLSRF